MIPLRDVIPTRTTPVVTIALIAVNVLVFLYQWSLGSRAGTTFIVSWGLIPADFPLSDSAGTFHRIPYHW